MSILGFRNVDFIFYDTGFRFLSVSNLDISQGINYIIGRNGAGKTSFLHALSGIYPNIGYSGNVTKSNSTSAPIVLGLISQNPEDSIIPDLTFLENLVFSNLKGLGYLSLGRLLTRTRINDVEFHLDEVAHDIKVDHLLDRPARQLSGGEKQLLAILMRSYRGSDILLLDEITASLDDKNTAIVMNLISAMAETGKIILFSTHQYYLTEEYPGCVYLMKQKQLTKNESIKNLRLVRRI